jgi:hypothetical protein
MSKDNATEAQQGSSEIEVLYAEALSQHDKAIYEAGKTMLIDSIKTGRDFCQFMITTSIGAIPVYLAIATFLLPKDYSLGVLMSILVAGPAVIFLIAALIFALGYFPTVDYFSLNIIEEIEKARGKNILRRRKLAKFGFITFVVATLYAIVVFVLKVGIGL